MDAMQTGYGLNLEQAQKLIITPELRQAITVLQLPTTELAAYVEEQLQENPLLEVREDGDGQAAEDQDGPDYDWVEYFQDSSDLGLPARNEERETRRDQFWSTPPSLAEHLLFQLALHPCSGRIREIAEYLTGNIDENGYLQVGVEEVAAQLKVPVAEVEAALRVVQSLDPPGVGARDLQECLLLQVEHLGIEDGTLIRLINDHLQDVGLGRLNRVAQLMNLPVQEVQRAADRLRALDPKPGRNFAGAQQVRYIVPDVVVEKVAGEYVVLVNDVMVPRLTINNAYRAVLLQGKAGDSEARRFVESRLAAATWLIRSIEQRRLTLYKVARCLVDLQRDFLDHGPKYLKPLNLRQVAEIVGLHESTVSRATANKYMQTPRGIFEMKYFFSSGLNCSDGSVTSAESIKKLLQELVTQEDTRAPLSDRQIADFFASRGLKISRRTVAKYRQELGIPSVSQRRRY